MVEVGSGWQWLGEGAPWMPKAGTWREHSARLPPGGSCLTGDSLAEAQVVKPVP